jgi:hypothetical protein
LCDTLNFWKIFIQFDHSTLILRYEDKINMLFVFSQRIKNRLNIPAKVLIGYQLHRDLTVKNSSAIKNRFQV